MTEVPFYVDALFILTTIATLIFIFFAANGSKAVLFDSLSWLTVQGIIGVTGFYTVTNAIPPRFLLLIIPPVVLILVLLSLRSNLMRQVNTEWTILLHMVRIPVEIVLFLLFMHKQIPQLMTFEGGNLDILSGLSAPFIYWLYKTGKLSPKQLLAWNFGCLALLINIVTRAVLSAPFPFQQLAFDQPNIAVLYFPYVWLPCFIVPAVLFCHLAMITKTFRKLRTEGKLAL